MRRHSAARAAFRVTKGRRIGFSVVDFAAVGDAGYAYKPSSIVDEVDHTPVADSNPPLIFVALQLLAPRGSGFV